MPEISRFYGIVIKVFHNDHHPPHFHAEYGEDEMISQEEGTWLARRRRSPVLRIGPDGI